MPAISHHWVRLTEDQLHYILDEMPDVVDEPNAASLIRWADKVALFVEDGLETW